MRTRGVLEALAQADLDELLEGVRRRYQPGALDAVAATDPGWREALERAEREVGGLYAALCEADVTVAQWRRAVAELGWLWARVSQMSPAAEGRELEEVA